LAARPGKDLEALVQGIETCLSDDSLTTVESPARLIDKSTGRLREHDVLITRKEPHRTILTAIECRDRSRPVDAPAVEAFKKKCEETGIHKGVIVSSVGFARNARRKAARLDIDCLTLKEAAEFDWTSVYEIVGSYRRMTKMEAVLEPEGVVQEPVALWERRADGSVSDLSQDGHQWMYRHFEAIVESGTLDDVHVPGSSNYRLTAGIEPIGHLYLVDAAGKRSSLKRVTLIFEYEQQRSTMPTRKLLYGDPDAAEEFKVSTAKLPFRDPDEDVAVTIVERPDGTFKIHHSKVSTHSSAHISPEEK
jgi:Restriction endonuclease